MGRGQPCEGLVEECSTCRGLARLDGIWNMRNWSIIINYTVGVGPITGVL